MRYARLRFVVAFGVAAVAAGVALSDGSETAFAVATSVAGLAWAGMLLDEVRGAAAASAAFGTTACGFTRGQVARGIVLSWLIPGLGQIYAGERIAGLLGGEAIRRLPPARSLTSEGTVSGSATASRTRLPTLLRIA